MLEPSFSLETIRNLGAKPLVPSRSRLETSIRPVLSEVPSKSVLLLAAMIRTLASRIAAVSLKLVKKMSDLFIPL